MNLIHHLKAALGKTIQLWEIPLPPPNAGIYHYLRGQAGNKARLHLRVESDGRGTLLINASRMIHLNPTATYMAYLFLNTMTDSQAVHALSRYYDVPKDQAGVDYNGFKKQMEGLLDPDSSCPICDLDLETTAPFSHTPSAPYRMDLALTYRCNNACSHCYNPLGAPKAELGTTEWKQIIDTLWELNIPHIIFTGGEPTLRQDLAELIAHAEKNGQITGLNTNGRRLRDEDYLQTLVDAGLDHVQITLESHLPEIHDHMVNRQGAWQDTVCGIRNALKTRLFVMTNTTLLRRNTTNLPEMLEFLAYLGVPTAGLNTLIYAGHGLSVKEPLAQSELNHLLRISQDFTTSNQMRLIWYTPTQYCHFNPVEANLGVKGCTAALYNMCIEPDGEVIPCQSYYHPLGNICRDPWHEIWNHPLALHLRERKYTPAECQDCELLQSCGSGCPLALQTGAYPQPRPLLFKPGTSADLNQPILMEK